MTGSIVGGVVIFTVIPASLAVIPACAGIQRRNLLPTVMEPASIDFGLRRNDGCRSIAMMKTYAGLW